MAGLLIRVDLQRLAATTKTARAAADGTLVRALRAYSSTHSAAAALLAGVTGVSPQALCRLNLGDVTPESVSAQETHAVPEVAREMLAAYIHTCLMEGASQTDPLFPARRGRDPTKRSTPRALRMTISAVAQETGLMLWSEWHTSEDLSSAHWLRRRGVAVRDIT